MATAIPSRVGVASYARRACSRQRRLRRGRDCAHPRPFTGTVAAGDIDGTVDESPSPRRRAPGERTEAESRLYQTIGRGRLMVHFYDQGCRRFPRQGSDDGAAEIVIPSMDGRLYVLNGEGEDWGPYPIELCFPGTEERDYADLMCV